MTKIRMIFGKTQIGVVSKKDLITCLQLLLINLDHYSPKSIFLENIDKALETVYELSDLLKEEADNKLAREITSFKRKITGTRNSFNFIKTKEDAIALQYNILLAFEGLGTLTGFGGANKFGDKIDYFNPERMTIL